MKIIPTILIISALLLIVVLAAAGCGQTQAAITDNAAVTASASSGQNTIAQAPTSSSPGTITPPSSATAPKAETAVIKIGDILKQPKQFEGKTVNVQGKIVNECGSGCWFTLKDDTGTIYIDLAPNNMVIPQKRGANARVTAVVEIDGKDVFLVGSRVDF